MLISRAGTPVLIEPWFARLSHSRARGSSSQRWLDRQHSDPFARQAKTDNYKSRAAYKLKEMNTKYKLFRKGQTVVDLGFAPGSWSQVAVQNTRPGGRVIGVDLLPVEPPEGVSTIQGNFLDPGVQNQLRVMLSHPARGRWRAKDSPDAVPSSDPVTDMEEERTARDLAHPDVKQSTLAPEEKGKEYEDDIVLNGAASQADVVLSDMCGIWPQQTGFWTNSINTPYRLANTSGVVARDHAMSIDLCDAALVFSLSHLRTGGSFVCKFYTGSEDAGLERRLKRAFKRVWRDKPSASRSASREAYFVAKNKRTNLTVDSVFAD